METSHGQTFIPNRSLETELALFLMTAIRKMWLYIVGKDPEAGTDGTAQAVNVLAQVYWSAAHYKAVAFIQVEHDFFEDKGRNFLKILKHG